MTGLTIACPDPLPFAGGGGGLGGSCGNGSCNGGICQPGAAGPLTGGPAALICTSCLDAETQVPLYGGSSKRAIDVQVGDKLISDEGCPELVVDKRVGAEARLRLTFSHGELVCSESHHLLRPDRSEVVAGTLAVGDKVLAADGEQHCEVETTEHLPEGEVVGFSCQPSHVYRCGGLLHHNKQIAISPQAGA